MNVLKMLFVTKDRLYNEYSEHVTKVVVGVLLPITKFLMMNMLTMVCS
jgi:hypothetical protein